MYACVCRAVTVDQVQQAIADGAETLSAVARATRACTVCGSCRQRLLDMLGTPVVESNQRSYLSGEVAIPSPDVAAAIGEPAETGRSAS